jgi:poly-gamma-glutamate capsule biosynthesis protein CapA/YwtB (metallophosphatase superfamily)
MTNMRNALKAVGAVLAVVALCAPLMLLPSEDTEPVLGFSGVTITVPPTVVVATTIPGFETTTTTTEAPPPPPEPTSSTTTTTGPIDITIAATGDVVVSAPLLASVRDPLSGSYAFGPVFAPIAPYLAQADYAVAALEPRLAGPQARYSADPKANAPRELAFALKKMGIDLVATANSHSLDLGWEGVVGTLDRLDAADLAHVGTARSRKERTTPVIANIRGIKVAFLNYTSSVAERLPAADKKDYAVNMLDVATVKEDAMTARSWGADAVVAMLNYGVEYDGEPSVEQVALSKQILDGGVDAILGSHARVVQPIGHIFTYASWRANDKYVAYSLGDFLPAQETDRSDSGLIAYLHLEKRDLRTYVTGVSYLPLYVQVSDPVATGSGTPASGEQPTKRFRVLPVLPGLEPDTDVPLTADDKRRMTQIWEDTRALLYRPDEKMSPLAPGDMGL